jgi:hypothetical protein
MFARLAAALLLALAAPCLTCGAAVLENPGDAVKVVDARIITRQQEGRDNVVTVLGSLKNETGQPVSALAVEARLLDAQGQLVDVLTDKFYDIAIMPGEQAAFRLQGSAASPLAAYAQVQARVTSGERREAEPPKAQSGWGWNRDTLMSLLVSWGPMLLLIAVWIVFIRLASSKKSPQLNLIAEQNALVQRQAAALEKLVEIASGKTAPPPA